MSFYQSIEDTIIEQIHKYKPDLTVTDAAVSGDLPDYPFVVYDQPDDGDPVEFNDYDHEISNIGITLKAVSDDKNEAKDLGRWLRKLLFLQMPKYELAQKAIVALSVQKLPAIEDFLDVDWQFSSGAEYLLQVQDNYVDETQPGTLGAVNPIYTQKRSDK